MTVNNMVNNQMQTNMIRLASGQRINSAADDAAGLGISERMTAQMQSLDRATNNVMDMQNLVNTAEGGLSNINNSLQRIRELNVQASNGILTQADRQIIQNEVDQLVQEINAVSSRTEFNGMRLLDGSFSGEDTRNLHTAADAMGRGPAVTIGNMSSGMLLPDGIDVVNGSFDINISRIDNALSMVSAQRSYLGAMSNRFDTTIAANQITNLNQAASRSRIRDADMALEMMNLQQSNVLMQAQLMAQRRRQEQESAVTLATIR